MSEYSERVISLLTKVERKICGPKTAKCEAETARNVDVKFEKHDIKCS